MITDFLVPTNAVASGNVRSSIYIGISRFEMSLPYTLKCIQFTLILAGFPR